MSEVPLIDIATHDGPFHADEVLSVAILSKIFKHHRVIRTRDQVMLDMADFVVDVGGVYNHTLRRYDHHMKNPPKDDTGHLFSSAGLIWYHYHKAYLQAIGIPSHFTHSDYTISLEQQVEKIIRTRWIQPIDRWDNGIYTGPTAISELVAAMAPTDPQKSRAKYNEQFLHAVSMVSLLFERACFHAADHSIAKVVYIRSEKQKLANDRILVAETDVKEFGNFAGLPTHFVIYPVIDHNDGETHYNIRPIFEPSSKTYKTSLPERMFGLNEPEILEMGVEGITFVHHTGFMAKARTKEAAIAFCLDLLEK